MNGEIARFICSMDDQDIHAKNNIFQEGFRVAANWTAFLNSNLAGGTVATQLKTRCEAWTPQTFQAIFIGFWSKHPTEKGSYMIDLGGLTIPERSHVEGAVNNLPSRKSSHLSGKGHSASRDWGFLEGYAELLVQYEVTDTTSSLFLKTEGHTTGVSGIAPHIASWVKKEITGSGMTANASLRDLAEAQPGMIEPRAAENFGKGYKSFVKGTDGINRQSSIRDVMVAIYDRFEDPSSKPDLANMDVKSLGRNLLALIVAHGEELRAIHTGLPSELQSLAITMMNDEDGIIDRVYREVRASADSIDRAIANFNNIANEVAVFEPR